MGQTANLFFPSFLAVFVSAMLSWVLARCSRRFHLVAVPTGERWSQTPIPNSGGLAILMSCAAVWAVWFQQRETFLAVASVVVALLGYWDDRKPWRPSAKLTAQTLIAAGLVVNRSLTVNTAIPVQALEVLWIVTLTNAFNLIDNMDGLCAGVTVIVTFTEAAIFLSRGFSATAGFVGVVGLAYMGFLLLNYQPARIFMGDCGSQFAGFFVAGISLDLPFSTEQPWRSATGLLLLFAYPLFDTALVTFTRTASGRLFWVGGRDHSSHRLAMSGFGERLSVWLIWIFTAITAGGADLLISALSI